MKVIHRFIILFQIAVAASPVIAAEDAEPDLSDQLMCAKLALTHALLTTNDPHSPNSESSWHPPFSLPASGILLAAESLHLQCLVNTTLVGEVSKRTYKHSRRKFLPPYTEVLAGKSTEVALQAYVGKPFARAIGKVLKGAQSGKDVLKIASSAFSAGVAKHFVDKYIGSKSSLLIAAGVFTTFRMLEEYSETEPISPASDSAIHEKYKAVDYWLLRPFAYKPAFTCARYCFEKIVQQQEMLQKHLPNMIATLLTYRYFSKHPESAKHLAEGVNIGVSKVLSSGIANLIVASSELRIDALSENPEYKDLFERSQKVLVDMGIGLISSALIGILLPITLVAINPSYIAIVFFIYLNFYYGRFLI